MCKGAGLSFRRRSRPHRTFLRKTQTGDTAEYFDLDPTLVRLAWVVFCALGGSGILAYIIAALIIPRRPEY